MNAVVFSMFVVLLIKQTADCSSVVCSTEQTCQLSHCQFNRCNALIFPWSKMVNFVPQLPHFCIVPPPEYFRDAFCVAEGAFGRPCKVALLNKASYAVPFAALPLASGDKPVGRTKKSWERMSVRKINPGRIRHLCSCRYWWLRLFRSLTSFFLNFFDSCDSSYVWTNFYIIFWSPYAEKPPFCKTVLAGIKIFD